jgi:hypothetical protein
MEIPQGPLDPPVIPQDAPPLLRRLAEEVTKITWVFKDPDAAPNVLYHYTDAPGLLGILRTNQLWASSIRHLNDALELEYAAGLVRQIALTLQPATERGQLFVESMARLDSRLLFEGGVTPGLSRIYVACFCERDDLLGMWRSYGDLGGMSVGMNAHLLASGVPEFQSGALNFRFVEVAYDRDAQVETLTNVLRLGLEASDSVEADTIQDAVASIFFNVMERLAPLLIAYKSPGFADEHEWRAVRGEPETICFRSRGNLIVPFTRIEMTTGHGVDAGRLPVRSVTVGPGMDSDANLASVQDLTAASGYKMTEVRQSEVRLRW